MTRYQFTLVVASVFVTCIASCGKPQLLTIPVSGRVTFDGGDCPAEGTITFSPESVQQGFPRRPGTAQFGADGQFTVTSFREGDGLIPGRYRPIVSCWKGEPRNDDPSSFERLSYVPKNFKAEEVAVTPADKSVVVSLNVPKK